METIIIAIRSVFSHKLRSILTMLGIIIGIGSIICIFSIIQGNTEQMKKQFIGGVSGTLSIDYDKKSRFDSSKKEEKEEKPPLYIPEIQEPTLKKIKEELNLKNISVSYKADKPINYKNASVYSQISSIKAEYLEMKPVQLIQGRLLSKDDIAQNRQVVMISEELFDELSQKEGLKMGDYIEMDGMPLQVIGVFKTNEDDDFLQKKIAYVPYDQSVNVTSQFNNLPIILIQTNDVNNLQNAALETSNYLNKEFPTSDYEFGVENFSEYQKRMEEINKSSMYMLIGIASISLLVGGIGVMNIMLVSITERTKEIGLKKALGAQRKSIIVQFLIEAIALTIVGGIIGVVLGIFSGVIITHLLGYPYVFSIFAILGSLLFSVFIGIVFGILPAINASKLNPIQALRSE